MARSPIIWLLTDNKPGHRNQLRGLALHLEALAGARCFWIDSAAYPLSLWSALRGKAPHLPLPPPDLVIAAGSRTHRLLLACRRAYRAFSVVLMKPAFPLGWVDAAIIPAHDLPPERPQVLSTQGVLNTIQPVQRMPDNHQGLMLIGGESRHFVWDGPALLPQITQICTEQADWQWTLTTSRRTPETFIQTLKAHCPANLHYVDHRTTPPDWLPRQLAQSGQAWVSPDSVSMVYECLSSGVPTGLFDLPPRGQGRIVRGIQQLREQGRLTGYAQRQQLDLLHPAPPLQEAARAAQWLLQRWRTAVAA